jgi:hypothetical protein
LILRAGVLRLYNCSTDQRSAGIFTARGIRGSSTFFI